MKKPQPLNRVFKINIPKVAETEVSPRFLQRMADAMGISFFKYGKVADSAGKTNYLKSAADRIKLYREGGVIKGNQIEPGNIWYLADAANFLMMEAMNPTIANAEWGCNESDNSPGRHLTNGRVTDSDNHGRTQAAKASDSTIDLLERRLTPAPSFYGGRQGD